MEIVLVLEFARVTLGMKGIVAKIVSIIILFIIAFLYTCMQLHYHYANSTHIIQYTIVQYNSSNNIVWTYLGFSYTAVCDPECDNGGTCVGPGQCHCTEHYSGPRCQQGKS